MGNRAPHRSVRLALVILGLCTVVVFSVATGLQPVDAYQAGGTVQYVNTTTGRQTGYSGLTTTLTVTSGKSTAEPASTMNSGRDWSVGSTTYTPSAVSSQRGLQWVASGVNCSYPNAGQTVTNCDKGSVTFTFSRPVRNPVFHVHDFGGRMEANCKLAIQGTLNRTASSPDAVTLTKLSGGIVVSGSSITGRSSTPPTTESNHSSGSVQLTGMVSSVTFSFKVALYREGSTCSYDQYTMQVSAVERLNATFSYQEDFGDGAASYDVSAAASHVIGDLRLGGPTISAEAASTLNSSTSVVATSPLSSAAANGDDDDALATRPADANIGQDYTLSVPISGASQAGQVCGFIDLNNDGAYSTSSPDEHACTGFAAGDSSVDLTWTADQWPVDAVPAVDTGLRLRAAYGTGGAAPTGPADSGEVEDYLITLVSPLPPVADPLTSMATQDENQTVTPTVSEGIFTPSLTCIVDEAGCVSSYTAPGEGTYTVNADGTITFDPLASFTGEATPITYRVEDTEARQSTATVSITVVPPPTSIDDSLATTFNTPTTVETLANDSAALGAMIDPTTLRLCDVGEVPPACSADSVTIAGEGTFTRDTTTGDVTFTPVSTFIGTASLDYQVADDLGGMSSSTILVNVEPPAAPAAAPTTSSGIADTNQSITLDASPGVGTNLDPLQTCIDDNGSCVRTLTISGEGTYTVNADGTVTFDPDPTFAGPGTVLTYRVEDETGQQISSTLQATVVGEPVVVGDAVSTPFDTDVVVSVLENDAADVGAILDVSSVAVCAASTAVGSCSSSSLTVPGEGTYSANADGTVSFDPLATFVGSATPVQYVVADSLGQVAAGAIVVSVDEPPVSVGVDDVSAGADGAVQKVDPLVNDTTATGVTLDPTSVRLCAIGGSAPCGALSVAIPGEGVYDVDAVTGGIAFTPVSGLSGSVTPIQYSVIDSLGRSIDATYIPTVVGEPLAVPDTAMGSHDAPQVVEVLGNDTVDPAVSLDPTTLRICSTGTVVASCLETTLSVVGEGMYTVNADGTVTFDPLPTFIGDATPIAYAVSDSVGQATLASLGISVLPPPAPVAGDEQRAVLSGETVTFTSVIADDGLADGVGLQTGQVAGAPCLIEPRDQTCAQTVTVAGEGTWTIDEVSGIVTFTADAGLAAQTLTPVRYQVTDVVGQSGTGTLTAIIPSDPSAEDDLASGPAGSSITIDVLSNDEPDEATNLDVESLRLCSLSPAQQSPNCTATAVTIAGEGTLGVVDGIVTFVPIAGFTGPVTPVGYQVADELGQTAHATITIVVTDAISPVLPRTPSTPDRAPTDPSDCSVQRGRCQNEATDDSSLGGKGQVQWIGVLGNDVVGVDGALFVADSVRLCNPAVVDGPCDLLMARVAGEGTYEVRAGGVVLFTPDPEFVGDASPVSYEVFDEAGNSVRARLLVVVGSVDLPFAQPDRPSGIGPSVSVDPVANDVSMGGGLVPGTVRLCGVGESVPLCSALSVETSEGVYVVDPETGVVTFTAASGFSGVVSQPVTYQVSTDVLVTASNTTSSIIVPSIAVALPTTGSSTTSLVAVAVLLIVFGALIALVGNLRGSGAVTPKSLIQTCPKRVQHRKAFGSIGESELAATEVDHGITEWPPWDGVVLDEQLDHQSCLPRGAATHRAGVVTPILMIHTIFEGTSEIQQLVIARAISGLRIE